MMMVSSLPIFGVALVAAMVLDVMRLNGKAYL